MIQNRVMVALCLVLSCSAWGFGQTGSRACPEFVDIDGMGAYPWFWPFRADYADARTMSLYRAEEFPCARGTITAVAFYVETGPTVPVTLNNLTIRLRQTGANQLGNTFINEGWTVCYQWSGVQYAGDYYCWVGFPFTTSFVYDRASPDGPNLLVDFSFNNTAPGQAGSKFGAYSFADSQGQYRTVTKFCNNCNCGGSVDPLLWTTCAGVQGNPLVPRVLFTFEPDAGANGACCTGNFCEITEAAACKGTYLGDGTTCEPWPCVGACCLGDGSCQVAFPSDCDYWDGTFKGYGTVCDPNVCTAANAGACCFPDGHCARVPGEECPGSWFGEGTTCAQYPCEGACCHSNGSCEVIPESRCLGWGFVWQGDGTNCAPNICPQPGACCEPDGGCADLQPLDCVSGNWLGAGTHCWEHPCSPTFGACCLATTCSDLTQADCQAAGGSWGLFEGCSASPCPLCDRKPLAEVFASDAADDARFGAAVALDGDRAVVGAYEDHAGGLADAGSAYVLARAGGTWQEEAKLVATDAVAGQWIGMFVALSGDTAGVGAPYSDPNGISDAGAVYVFVRGTGGTWTQQAKLTAGASAATDAYFGGSVAIEGDRLMIGASCESGGLGKTDAGAVYVFTRAGDSWSQSQKLTLAGDAQPWDHFGSAVALQGNTAVIGAYEYRYDPVWGVGPEGGSAYGFTFDGTTWSRLQELPVSDAPNGFGCSVALDGDTAVVGADIDTHSGAYRAGSAYVFVRLGQTWYAQQKLVASDPSVGDAFGSRVAVHGDTAAVGAPFDDTNMQDGGSAYVFLRTGYSWNQHAKLTVLPGQTPGHGDDFGRALALSADALLVGAPFAGPSGPVANDTGAVYVYAVNCAGACCFADGSCDVQAPEECELNGGTYRGGGTNCGLVYCQQPRGACCFIDGTCQVQTEEGCEFSMRGTWQGADSTCAPNPCPPPLGACCLADGQCFHVAQAACTAPGAAWEIGLDCQGGTCPLCAMRETTQLLPEDAAAGDYFGLAVALDGDTALIGAPFDGYDDPNGLWVAGAAYVFVRSGGTWTQQAKLTADDAEDLDELGRAVALDGDTAVVGTARKESDTGAVYVFVRESGVWTQQAKLTAGDPAPGDEFGRAVAVHGDAIVVGAPGKDAWTGAAYVFVRNQGAWQQSNKLGPDPVGGDWFGAAVALQGDTALIGAPYQSTVYVFQREGASWNPTKLSVAGANGFGCATALDAGTAVIGVGWEDGMRGIHTGCAYVFVRVAGNWIQEARLAAGDGVTGDAFGGSVAVQGDTAAIGALGDDLVSVPNAGSAYIFTRWYGTWTQRAKLTSPNPQAYDQAQAVSISDGTVLLGGMSDPGGLVDAGAVYAFSVACAGACCFVTGSCDIQTSADCDALGGTYLGSGAPCGGCPPAWACCFPNGTCADLTLPACTSQGGMAWHDGATCAAYQCPQPGACCRADGHCEMSTLIGNCATGIYLGDDTDCSACPAGGACCFADGTCDDLTQVACTGQSGTWHADEACATYTCPQPAACCYADGSCASTLESACTGTWHPGVDCAAGVCQQPGGCCLADDTCQTLTDLACQAQGGLFLGKSIACAGCSSDGDVDHGEQVTLNPGGGSGDPLQDALVTFTNTSVPAQDDAWVHVGETSSNPHPDAGGFAAFGHTLIIETSLPDGAFRMTVQIPFARADLPPNQLPLNANLTYYNAATNRWMLAVEANTQNSPGHSGKIGDRYPVLWPAPPNLTSDLGDYGVYWNLALQAGFVWANVDHCTSFAPGAPGLCRGDTNCDGRVNSSDIDPFVEALYGESTWNVKHPNCPWLNADCNDDGRVTFADIDPFVAVIGRTCP